MKNKTTPLNPPTDIKLYVMYDRVAEKASVPTPSENDATAARDFSRAIADHPPEIQLDFQLLYVGRFDTRTSTLKPENPPSLIPVLPLKKEEKNG